MVQWFRLCISTAGGKGSTPARRAKTSHVLGHGQKKRISLLFVVELHFIVCIYHILLTHSPLDEYLGRFHVRAIMSNVAINIHIQIFIWTHLFTSLRYTARYITMFNHLWNCRLFSKAASLSYIPTSSL